MTNSPAQSQVRIPQRRRRLLAAVVFAVVFVGVWLAMRDSGDSSLFEGRRVSEVVEEIIRRDDEHYLEEADFETLERLGPERAVPELSRYLFKSSLTHSPSYESFLNRMPQSIKGWFPEHKMRQLPLRALDYLNRFDEAASNALPGLVKLIERPPDDETRSRTLNALANLGTASRPAFPALTNLLAQTNCLHRPEVYRIMTRFGEEAAEVLPYARAGANDQDESIRMASAWMLLTVAKDTNAAFAIIRDLSLNGTTEQVSAVSMLANFGPIGLATFQELMAKFDGLPRATKDAVISCLILRGDETPEGPKLLAKEALENRTLAPAGFPSAWPRASRASLALYRLGPRAAAAVPLLLTALQTPNHPALAEVCRLLGRIRGPATNALPDLVRLWKERPGTEVSREAALAIWNMDKGATFPAAELAAPWREMILSRPGYSSAPMLDPELFHQWIGLHSLLKEGAPEFRGRFPKVPAEN